MELRTLQYFVTIAKEENITRAANSLHITQPTLSRQMKILEDELNVKLFTRGNHNVVLTEEGQLFKKRAEELLAMSKKIQNEFQFIGKPIEGDIYLGCGETKEIKHVGKVLKFMQQTYPKVRLHIYSGNAEDISNRLDKGLLDFGILIQPVDLTKYEFLNLPSYDEWGVVARKDSDLSNKGYVTKEDLVDLPLICSRQAIDEKDNNEFKEWFGSLYSNLNMVATYNLAYNAGIMVEEKVGYALALDSIINTTESSDLCFIPFYPKLTAKHNIVWRKNHHFSKAAELFLNELKNEFTQF